MPIRGIVLLGFFVASLPVCFIRPFFGVALWAIVAFLAPQAYIWGNSLFPWAMAVAIPTLCGFPLFSRGWKNLSSGKVLLIVLLWVWFTITSVISTNTPLFMHHAADTWATLQFVSKVLLMTLVTVVVVDSLPRLRKYVIVIATCFAVFVAKSLPFLILSGGRYRIYGPQNTMIADNNDLGLALNMTLPLFFFLAKSETKRWVKTVFGALFVMTIPTIFFTYSRGAMLGLVVLLGLMLLRLKGRVVLIPVLALGAIIAVAFAPQAWRERMDPDRAVDSSARERFNAWTFSWNLAKESPLTGGGFRTFTPELFSRYAPVAGDIRGPHSIYFGVLAEHGFPGLLLYLSLLAISFRSAARLIKEARQRQDMWVVNYANMFRFSLVGFVTSGAFLGRAYFDYFFAVVACLVVLERLVREHWSREVDDDYAMDSQAEGFSLPDEALLRSS